VSPRRFCAGEVGRGWMDRVCRGEIVHRWRLIEVEFAFLNFVKDWFSFMRISAVHHRSPSSTCF